MFEFQHGPQLGLILIGGVFVWSGVHHFLQFRTRTAWLASKKWPAPAALLTLGALLEIAGGLALITGQYVQIAALALIVFTVVASVTLLDFWNQTAEARTAAQNAFTGNIALIGGLILACSVG
jgi:putative oxidoreductase